MYKGGNCVCDKLPLFASGEARIPIPVLTEPYVKHLLCLVVETRKLKAEERFVSLAVARRRGPFVRI